VTAHWLRIKASAMEQPSHQSCDTCARPAAVSISPSSASSSAHSQPVARRSPAKQSSQECTLCCMYLSAIQACSLCAQMVCHLRACDERIQPATLERTRMHLRSVDIILQVSCSFASSAGWVVTVVVTSLPRPAQGSLAMLLLCISCIFHHVFLCGGTCNEKRSTV
jgi:hypothetical protein